MFAGDFPVNQKSGMVPFHSAAKPSAPANLAFGPGAKAMQAVYRHIGEAILSTNHPRKPSWKPRREGPDRGPHGGGKFHGKGPGGPRRNQGRDAREDDHDGPVRLFGLHSVEAALRNPRRKVLRLVLTENAERRLTEALGALPHAVEQASPRELDRILGADTVHQGAMLETEALPEPDFAELVAHANGRPLIVLDQVTDPHNVGAILRSAAAFGAAGLVMTRRHSPPLNGVLAKSASGALELIPVALVANLARALDELNEIGFNVVGLDGEAEARIEDLDWSEPTAIVMGAEGKGLRELTAKTCQKLARITTDGPFPSLNVSNAAAVALHTAALGAIESLRGLSGTSPGPRIRPNDSKTPARLSSHRRFANQFVLVRPRLLADQRTLADVTAAAAHRHRPSDFQSSDGPAQWHSRGPR